MKKEVMLAVLVLMLFSMLVPCVGEVRYNVVDLGTLGGMNSCASAINEQGQIVGWANINDGYTDTYGRYVQYRRAFVWQNDNMTSLGTLTNRNTAAYDINNNGQVVGTDTYTYDTSQKAFFWENGVMTQLNGIDASGDTTAYGINDSGQVVGSSSGNAVSWQNGVISVVQPYYFSRYDIYYECYTTRKINNNGFMIGECYYSGEHWERIGGCYWQNGTKTEVSRWQNARDVNDNGQIVGAMNGQMYEGGHPGVYYYHPNACLLSNGILTNLGTLGGNESTANGINNLGQVVGESYLGDAYSSPINAFIWENGVLNNLNSLISSESGWTLNYAYDINDSGWIVGQGTINGQQRAFLLTPVPEPSSLAALICGLGGFGGVMLRRRK